jgi:hypothetical protein
MSRRPTPQPASRPRIVKASEDHPAAAAAPQQVAALQPTPKAAPVAPTNAPTEHAPVLVPFSTRIPQDLRDHYEWLRFTTRKSVQELVTQALTAYAERHPRS